MKKIKLKEMLKFSYNNIETQKNSKGEKITVNVTPENYPVFIKLSL